jgi:hypothetical protein
MASVPSTARAQDDFSRYLKAAARLYKSLEYERALDQVQRAKKLANTLDQDVAVALHEGIILADMGKRDESLVAFKTALLLEPEAKLPFKVSPKMERDVEEIRTQVRKELVESPPAPPAPATSAPEAQALARKEPGPQPPPASSEQPAPAQPPPGDVRQAPARPSQAVSPLERRSPIDRTVLLERVAGDEAQLRQQGNDGDTSPAMAQLKEIREKIERAKTSGQRMDVAVRLDTWERQFLAQKTASAKAEPQVSAQAEPAPASAPVSQPSRPSPIDRTTLLKRVADYEEQLRQRSNAADGGPAMMQLKEMGEQAARAATSGQRMDLAMKLDNWKRQFLPPLLTPSEIMKVVTAHEPAVAECVEKQRKQQPGLSGKLEMRWSVQADGSAREVSCLSGEQCSTYLAGCLTGLIQGWIFSARGGAAETVEFSFTF